MKKNANKKIQYSKILPIITCIIFIACLCHAFMMDLENYTDLTVVATSITVSGSIFGTCVVWYMKKAQSENNVKLKIELYKIASQEKLKYNKQMMILKQKYQMSDEDIMDIENESPMEDYETKALSSIEDAINMAESEAESPVEIQT